MAEEKITEMLTETELDSVVGGTELEYGKDFSFMRAIGEMPPKDSEFPARDVARAFAKYGIAYIYQPYEANSYFMNGKEISRETALKTVFKKSGVTVEPSTGKKINLKDYLL